MRRPLLALLTLSCASPPAPRPIPALQLVGEQGPPDLPLAPPPAPGYIGQGEESVPPELIARYAPGPLDAAETARIQAVMDLRSPSGGFVTSKGDRIVFNWSVTGVNQVWRQDGPMRFPIQLTGGADATAVEAISPDDGWAVVSRDRGGQENPGLYVLALEGGPLVEILQKPKVSTRLAFISDDARHVYYTANDLDPSSFALHRWERATGKHETLVGESGYWAVLDHLGDKLLLAKLLSNQHAEIWELDEPTKKLTPLIGQGDNESYDARYGARPGTLLVVTDKLADVARLYEWRAGTFTPLSPEGPYEVESLEVDRARTKVLYEVNRDGWTELHVLDARTMKPLALPELPAAENVAAGVTSANGRFTNLTIDGSTLPATTVTYDWQTKRTITWRVPAAPEVDVAAFARGTLERYPARDGTPIPMFVHRPAKCAREPCPVVVSFHGGPESQSRGGWNRLAQMFVDAGFVYVEPNVRGSSGYGKKWVDADNGARRLDVVTDIEDCARFIKKSWAKDGVAPKVGITGGSYGGYATLLAMTYFAGAYDAGVSEVGIANLLTFLSNTAPYRRAIRAAEYGDPVKDRDALVKLSPITYIDRARQPLLILQGVNDPRVPVGEALIIHDALQSRGIDTGLVLFSDEGHGNAKRSNQVLSIGHTLAFFKKHLL